MPSETLEFEWSPEEMKAAERIGPSSDQAMRWLIKFAQTDLANLSEGQWSDLIAEVQVFTKRGPPLKMGRSTTRISASFTWKIIPPADPHAKDQEITIVTQPSREQIAFLQKWAFVSLDCIAKGGIVQVAAGTLLIGILTNPPPGQGHLVISTDNPKAAFGFHFAHLLAEYVKRIRRCTECQLMFLSERRNQRFCTTRCLTRTTQRRWRERQLKKKSTKGRKRSHKQPSPKGEAHHGKKRRQGSRDRMEG